MKALAALLLMLGCTAANAAEYSFDPDEFKKKSFEFGGYLELKSETMNLREGSAGYKQSYYGQSQRSWLERGTGTLELTGKYDLGDLTADARGRAQVSSDAYATSSDYDKLMEGGLRWSPAKEFTLDAGKRVQRWGKGYAWNPVGLIERPKDPNDPLASREGYVMVDSDWIRTLSGPVQSIGLTTAIVPSKDRINTDFGKGKHTNPAAKLYLLAADTDIDFVWLGKGSRPQSVGMDFSRNISTAIEIHGEWARTFDAPRATISSNGTVTNSIENRNSYLLGLRYLTANEVTWITEYYHNGAGYSSADLENYYRFVDSALSGSGSPTQVNKALTIAQSTYGKSNPGRDYFYLRASVTEPFNWLYVTTAITTISNVNDGSFQVTPEVSYTGINNLEIRTRLIMLSNQQYTDFGEKTASTRLEVYARYSF